MYRFFRRHWSILNENQSFEKIAPFSCLTICEEFDHMFEGSETFNLTETVNFLMLSLDWAYLDAIYFAFISLSTIGFGDFVTSTYPPDKLATDLYNATTCFRALIDPVGKYALSKDTGLPTVCNPVIIN